METYDDEPTTRLKSALDINELKDPKGQGVEFEVEDDEVKKEGETEEDTLLEYYDKNLIASQICEVSDGEEDDDGDESQYDQDQLRTMPNEMESLYKKIFRLPNSDITPKKDGGILKQIKTLGVGNIVPDNSLVRIHYNAYTDVGQPPYDSSRLRSEVYKLRLGKNEAIPGLEIAILSMRRHEVSRFLIRHDYAFGKMGCPPRIPKEATIIMDVELVYYVEQEGVDDYYALTREERRLRLVFADIEKVVRAENTEGKEYFNNKIHNKAYGKFKKSINILESYSCKNEAEEKESIKWKIKAFVNCAICCHNLSHHGRVISFCNQALELDKKHLKALFYKGKSLHATGDFNKAEYFLKAARNVAPTDTAVSKALKALAKSKRDHEDFEKQMCQKMFRQTSINNEEEQKKASETPQETSQEEQENNVCSDSFKEKAQEALQTFNDDQCRSEMLFPPNVLNIAEISFIVETADALGLSIRSKGTGNSLCHEIYKKPKK